MKSQKINQEQFSSFINTEYPKPVESPVEVEKVYPMSQIMLSVEMELKELLNIVIMKGGNKLYYELIELKKAELELIYNYIKRD